MLGSSRSARLARPLSTVAAILAFSGSSFAGIVVIIEGTDATRNATVREMAGLAQTNYEGRGYTVNRLSNQNGPLTRQAVIDAIGAAGVNAVFFMGHGDAEADGTFLPGLVLDSGTGESLRPQDLPNVNGINHVEFQACGQSLQGWRDAFPNATLDAWRDSVTTDQIRNDLKNGSSPRIPLKTQPTDQGLDRDAPGMDVRYAQAIRNTPSYLANAGTFDSFFDVFTEINLQMTSSTMAQFGNQPRTMNLLTNGPGGTTILRGLTIANGDIVSESNSGYSSPDFSVMMTSSAFDLAMQNVDLSGSMFGSGAIITGNLTGVPDSILYQGFAEVYFGYGTIPSPSTLALTCAGLLAVTRRHRR